MRSARLTCFFAATLVLVTSAAACSSQPGPEKSASAFVSGWTKGQFDSTLQIINSNGSSLTGAAVTSQIKALAGDLAGRTPTITTGKAKVTKSTATVPLNVSWPIATGVTWKYQSTLRLQLSKSTWQPIWAPDVFEPDMQAQESLKVRSATATRGTIEDGSGTAIVTPQPVVHIGVQPNQVKDVNALVKALGTAFTSIGKDITLTDLPGRIKSASPTAFVDVVTLRQTDYTKIRSQVHDLPGTVFRTGTLSLAPSATFARALLGTVGDVTKERMDAKPGKYVLGDQVGFGGVQEQYDDRLHGTAGISVVIPGQGKDDAGTPNPDKTLFHTDPVAGQSVQLTLDPKTQNAAEAALVGEAKRAAIVAIRISDGHILAVANGPGAAPLDLGLTAQVPPGSMFKTVTAANLLEAGKITVNTPVNCTPTLTVSGYTIHNAEGDEQIGNVPLHVDFAKSCNTAFASLAPKLGPTGLKDTAAQLGIGIPWNLGINAFSGSVSANGDATEQAAAAFGQGKTLVSPVAMAAAAAAVARGQWKQPVLVLNPAVGNPTPDQPALKKSTVDALHQMMHEVVTSGTGVKVKNVRGPLIYGKTGTAEFDNNPAHTHSWFMGFRGDVAFAVFVEQGGMSTEAAVPIAGKFFTNLG